MDLSLMMSFCGFVLQVAAVISAFLVGVGFQAAQAGSEEDKKVNVFLTAASTCFTIGGFTLAVLA